MPETTITVGSNEADTTIFFTQFEIKREPVLVHGLWWPLDTAPASGKLYVKASIFMNQLGVISEAPSYPWKEFDSRMRFTREGLTLTATVEPIWIPFDDVEQEPILLPRGRYFMCHIYGTNAGADILTTAVVKTRVMANFNNTGTDNHFRADWTRTGGNYTTIDFSTMEYTDTTGFTGSESGTLAQLNWGLQVTT